jgi:hypothetical protein
MISTYSVPNYNLREILTKRSLAIKISNTHTNLTLFEAKQFDLLIEKVLSILQIVRRFLSVPVVNNLNL